MEWDSLEIFPSFNFESLSDVLCSIPSTHELFSKHPWREMRGETESAKRVQGPFLLKIALVQLRSDIFLF